MSIRLPNNSRIYPKTIEGFEAIEKCLREKTPIVVTSVDFDGTETTTVLWHPDDPDVPIESPRLGCHHVDRFRDCGAASRFGAIQESDDGAGRTPQVSRAVARH